MRFFNTAGACRPERHYLVPVEPRLPEVRRLIARESYFVVHAPRQTGKTTTLRLISRQISEEGELAALHFSCEAAKAFPNDVGAAERVVLAQIEARAEEEFPEELRPPAGWTSSGLDGDRLNSALRAWAMACPRPLVLVFDEIDALIGETLLSVLGQIRAGYDSRPSSFPASVILCGLRDVRDYKAASGGDPARLGTSSPFNIKVKSLRLGDFTEEEVRLLLSQHTGDTGQVFEEGAIERIWTLAAGQPWLTNALANEVVEEMGVEPPAPITAEHVEEARERLILARQTHLDSLVARLMETRVRRVLEPLVAGRFVESDEAYDDSVRYLRDLGLVRERGTIDISNPIYKEVIVRVLAAAAEDQMPIRDRRVFVAPDGRLELRVLLEEFAKFWRRNGEILASKMPYHEVAPQLVLMAYLQRVVNGGGRIRREYGVGRGRIDLLVSWPYENAEGTRIEQEEALELKVWAEDRPDPLAEGLEQLDGYLDGLGLDTGVLVIFDRRPEAGDAVKRTGFETARSPAGRSITVLRA